MRRASRPPSSPWGGKQDGDRFTEAEAGAAYLAKKGVPAEAIIAVGEGVDSLGSLEAAAPVLAERGIGSLVLVTDPWHSFRSAQMARDLGLEVATSPARSGPAVATREVQARDDASPRPLLVPPLRGQPGGRPAGTLSRRARRPRVARVGVWTATARATRPATSRFAGFYVRWILESLTLLGSWAFWWLFCKVFKYAVWSY